MNGKKHVAIIFFPIALVGVYFTTFYSYLLFHCIAEVFSITIAVSAFFFAWNSRKFLDNKLFLFIGIAYLFIAIIDLLHTLAYKGMGVFVGYDANLPTQLWIIARYTESISLFLAFAFFKRKINYNFVFSCYFTAISILLFSIFYWGIFPDCFIEGSGLTPFKKASEYIISLILFAAMVLLYRNRSYFEKFIFRLLLISLGLTIFAELAFTFYIGVYDVSNMIGHFFKIISFYLIYKAIIETGLKKPFELMFRNLKHSEENLKTINNDLNLEIQERKKAEARLNASLNEKETLLKEINHRVKNNMTVISGLLNLQMKRADDKKTVNALQVSCNRVQTMSMIHETLYRSDNFSSVDMKTYISNLGGILQQGYTVSNSVTIKIECENIMINVKQASPIGLIVNELITNSLKYAFPDDRKGEILVKLKAYKEIAELTVSDNGIGLPEGFDWQNTDSLGLMLVKNIAENQLDGSVDIENKNGTKVIIKFNIKNT